MLRNLAVWQFEPKPLKFYLVALTLISLLTEATWRDLPFHHSKITDLSTYLSSDYQQ